MKIVYISGVKFGLDLLEEILKHDFEISVVFSYHDSKKSLYSDFVTFDPICKKYGIQNFKVNSINDEKNIKILQSIKPDLILVMGWSQLLKNEVIKTSKLGVIGSHPTQLPKFRGRAPIPWTIIKGLEESALTFFFIEEGIDNGDILNQKKFKISQNDDSESLYNKITNLGKKMIVHSLQNLQEGIMKRIKQDETQFVEYWPKRTPEDGKIDWSKSAREISVLIRASTHPYPGAYTFFKNLSLKIFKAQFIDDKISKPGMILDVNKNTVKVGTNDGSIILGRVQHGSKKEVLATEIFSKDDVGKKLGR